MILVRKKLDHRSSKGDQDRYRWIFARNGSELLDRIVLDEQSDLGVNFAERLFGEES